MNPTTDWTSAIAILAAGVTLGILFVVFFNRKRKAARLGGDLERTDLEAKRDALVAQLRDESLDAEERARLELETADVLRKLDSVASVPAAAPQTQTPSINPATKGFLWGAASAGALALLFYFVMQQAAPRQEGGSLTGGDAPQQTQSAQADPRLQQLEAAVQRDPNNLQLRNDLAQAYLETDNMMAVFEQTSFVLQKSPDDSRALTFQALVRMAMGEAAEATRMLQRAAESDPKNLDSWVALAWVHAQNGNMTEAERMITEAAKNSPENKAKLDQVFVQMKQQIAQMPPDHPPVDTPAMPAAPPPSGDGVRVTLDLAPAAQPRSGVVFVIARNAAGGPPVAVKRVVASTFPLDVQLTAADSMMGQPLPPSFRLEARLDTDGDPMTRPETDPAAAQNEVSVGQSVRLSLQ